MAPRLLPRQRRFCDGVAAGLSGAEAARQAGYSPARSKSTAARLRAQPGIKAGIERRLNGYESNPRFDSPLQYLLWFMGNPEAALGLRVQAAIAATPYVHHRAP
jgi:hypothetical protein